MSKSVIKKQDLGLAVVQTPEVPPFNAPAVTAEVVRFGSAAARMLSDAQITKIEDPETAAVATDLLAEIKQTLKDVDTARKAVTGKFDQLVKGLNALYTKGPVLKLDQAAVILQGKLGAYVRAERAKADARAEEERKAIAARAAADAAAAVEEGDSEGALEILQGAASVEVVAEKVEVRGSTAGLSGTRRKVGKVTDLRAFLSWLVQDKTPMGLAMLGGISAGQRELNQLATAVITVGEGLGRDPKTMIPGFEAGYEETFGAR